MSQTYYPTSEDYNAPSGERVDLLKKLKTKLKDQSVSPAFWAVCQLADLDCLKDLCNSPDKFVDVSIPLAFQLIVEWNQSARADALDKCSEITSGTKRSRDGSLKMRSAAARTNCNSRDKQRCVLTGLSPTQVAHIFPFCLMKNGGMHSDRRAGFWEALAIFWTKDHIEKWKKAIFPDAVNPEEAIDSCENLISLNAYAHIIWNDGSFALKPVGVSPDKKELDLLFFWQPHHRPPQKIDLLLIPPSSKQLDCCGPKRFLFRRIDGGYDQLRSGDHVTLRTDDPNKQPLPSQELLEMQWILQRVVGMSGASDWPKLDLDSDSDSEVDHLEEENLETDGLSFKRICEERSYLAGTSIRSYDGVMDWIPVLGESLPKEIPLLREGFEALPSNDSALANLMSEKISAQHSSATAVGSAHTPPEKALTLGLTKGAGSDDTLRSSSNTREETSVTSPIDSSLSPASPSDLVLHCPVENCSKIFFGNYPEGSPARHTRKVHEMLHTYYCSHDNCDAAFTRQDNRNKHEARLHDQKDRFTARKSLE